MDIRILALLSNPISSFYTPEVSAVPLLLSTIMAHLALITAGEKSGPFIARQHFGAMESTQRGYKMIMNDIAGLG